MMRVQKRTGEVIAFDQSRITNAIRKALDFMKVQNSDEIARRLSDRVTAIIKQRYKAAILNVEEIQDLIERVLMKEGYAEVAKVYIIYRERHKELREAKSALGVKDEYKLSLNAVQVLERRYLLKDEQGRVIETPREMFRRVAKAIASVERRKKEYWEEEFFTIMNRLEFMPNSPTLMNAGTKIGLLSACFVLGLEDSLKSIFDTLKLTALTHQAGSGTGFDFSPLRPKGDIVKSTQSVASGPVSFITIFDRMTEIIKQGGRRRGANMAVLRVDHPDIIDFITIKSTGEYLKNFNISVAVTDKFMKAVNKGTNFDLINPRNNEVVKSVNAREIWNRIITNAWTTGDPGLIFIDEINRKHPLNFKVTAVNPCGEVPLMPNESCNLGSINLSKFVVNKKVNFEKLRKVVKIAVRFLDNVIDRNRYISKKTGEVTLKNRKIGLGVMGFAEMLILMGVPYNSNQALNVARKLMKVISEEARKASQELAKEKGKFPNFKFSKYRKEQRNATTITIAPTGSISIIAGASSGIEPLFALSFVRNVMGGTKLLEVNPIFEEVIRQRGIYSRELMMKVAKYGSCQKIEGISKDLKRLFVSALDIKPEWHVKMQAVFQKYTDNAVSKTINLPYEATISDVEKAYKLAYKLKCKGITVFRYGSKGEQVLYIGGITGKERGESEYVSAGAEFSGGCPEPYCTF